MHTLRPFAIAVVSICVLDLAAVDTDAGDPSLIQEHRGRRLFGTASARGGARESIGEQSNQPSLSSPSRAHVVRALNTGRPMRRTLASMTTTLMGLGLIAALGTTACGGQESDEPSLTGPSESMCAGSPSGGCYEIDPEYCVQLGCELRRIDERGAPICIGEDPLPCESISTPELCGRLPGCSWAG
jgi:hypothetical protein